MTALDRLDLTGAHLLALRRALCRLPVGTADHGLDRVVAVVAADPVLTLSDLVERALGRRSAPAALPDDDEPGEPPADGGSSPGQRWGQAWEAAGHPPLGAAAVPPEAPAATTTPRPLVGPPLAVTRRHLSRTPFGQSAPFEQPAPFDRAAPAGTAAPADRAAHGPASGGPSPAAHRPPPPPAAPLPLPGAAQHGAAQHSAAQRPAAIRRSPPFTHHSARETREVPRGGPRTAGAHGESGEPTQAAEAATEPAAGARLAQGMAELVAALRTNLTPAVRASQPSPEAPASRAGVRADPEEGTADPPAAARRDAGSAVDVRHLMDQLVTELEAEYLRAYGTSGR